MVESILGAEGDYYAMVIRRIGAAVAAQERDQRLRRTRE
jgi:hypothetical protein